MISKPIYLDNNSGTVPDIGCLEDAIRIVREDYGNPSSTHSFGESARAHIEKTRKIIAASIGASPSNLYFTSGGTEANAIALHTAPEAGDLVICPANEHSSVYNWALEKTKVLPDGTYDLNHLEDTFRRLKSWSGRKTLATSLINAETGVCGAPGKAISDLCRQYGVRHHLDAVAAYGKAQFAVEELGCDSLSISAHKIHALKGTACLWVKDGVKLDPIMIGGAQERGLRPGTENVMGIVMMGLVVEGWEKDKTTEWAKITALRDKFEGLLADISQINGKPEGRICNVSNLWFPAVKDLELFLYQLSEAGVMVSGQSACSSGMPAPSRVLTSMFGEGAAQLSSSIRVSLSKYTTDVEIVKAAEVIRKIVAEG